MRRLLATPDLAESLVIVNEFGAVGIDHHLLERSNDRTLLLENGCLCCALRGDLQETLVDVNMRRRRGELPGFDRVFIETSGLADPGPVAQTLYSDAALARDYVLARVVTLVDASDDSARRDAPELAMQQVVAADVVVLSKADRADDAALAASEAWVHRCNPFAECTPARHGDMDPSLLVAARAAGWRSRARSAATVAPQPTGDAHPHGVCSFALELEASVPRAAFDAFIDTLVRLRGADLLRVKGIVRFDDAPYPVLVQGMRHVFDIPAPLAPGTSTPAAPVLVFITRGVRAEEVRSLWNAIRTMAGLGGP